MSNPALAILQQAIDNVSARHSIRLTKLTPDASIERRPDLTVVSRANPFPQTDPLAPARAACRALVKRHVSDTGDTLARILTDARRVFITRDYHADQRAAGVVLGLVMLQACRRGHAILSMAEERGSPREGCSPVAADKKAAERLRLDAMAFCMMRLEAEQTSVEDWMLYTEGFTREEVFHLAWEAAQLAECIARIIAEARDTAARA